MHMKRILAALVMGAALVSMAGCPSPARPTEIVEFPDCDADDKIGKWDTEDCGPSPKPMKTAFQPKPKPTKKR